ncbi:hypothetical protein ACROYT_G035056 [Oculina patagonica]
MIRHYNLAALEKVVKIREYDEEYKLLRKIEELGMRFRLSEDLRSFSLLLETFCIRPKSKSSTLGQASMVQVTIIAHGSEKVQVPVTNDSDGSFSFSYKPDKFGDYKIEVFINGRYVHGSPFTWKVLRLVAMEEKSSDLPRRYSEDFGSLGEDRMTNCDSSGEESSEIFGRSLRI